MISCIIIAREFGKIQKSRSRKPFQKNSNKNNQRITRNFNMFLREPDIILEIYGQDAEYSYPLSRKILLPAVLSSYEHGRNCRTIIQEER